MTSPKIPRESVAASIQRMLVSTARKPSPIDPSKPPDAATQTGQSPLGASTASTPPTDENHCVTFFAISILSLGPIPK